VLRRPQAPQWRRIATPIALAAVSLFAALVLWIAVSDAENPQTEVEVPGVPVRTVNVPEDLAVVRIAPATVRLVVRADEDFKDSLSPADFDVTVDLTSIRETADLGIEADVLTDENVQVIRPSQPTVSVVLEPATSKQVPVRPNPVGTIPQGYSYSTDILPGTVIVSGARSLVDLVEYVSADVSLTGLRANLTQQVALTPRDARGLEIVRVQVEPARAETRITVQQQENTVQLPIVANLQGVVAEGYNIVGVVVDPSTVPVTGTLETTQAITSIGTEPVDVGSLNRDVTRTVRLRLPTGVQTSRDSVTVRVRIAPAPGEILVSVAPRVTGLGDGLSATLQTSTITLRLRGELPTLKTVTPGSVSATVDASNRPEGVNVLEPQISGLPTGVQVEAIDPAQVVVVIRR
jgi:YbbR domain-containing protein